LLLNVSLSILRWNRIATRYGAGPSGDRILLGARFYTPVQNGTGAHPPSYAVGTASFPGVKRPGSGVGHPPPSNADDIERVELYIYSASGPSWPVLGCSRVQFFISCFSSLHLSTYATSTSSHVLSFSLHLYFFLIFPLHCSLSRNSLRPPKSFVHYAYACYMPCPFNPS